MFKKLSILIIGCVLVGGFVFAAPVEPQDFVYLFHLYYDNGQLFADRDLQFKYNVIPETFVPEILNTRFPYRGEVINLKGEIARTFQFDPRQGNPKFLKGTLSVKAPYIPDGQKVVFYDSLGQSLLSIFVSESSFCNDDGVCNPDVGEDSKTCPNDCKQALPVPVASPDVPTGGGQSDMLMMVIYVLIIAGVAGLGGWYGGSAIWRRWQKRKQFSTAETPINFPPTPSSRNPV